MFLQESSNGHKSKSPNVPSSQDQHTGRQSRTYQPHNLPAAHYNGTDPRYSNSQGRNAYNNAPPSAYGYYTPPYMAKTFTPSPKSLGSSNYNHTTFQSPYKPKPNQSSPIGSLSRGVSSPFKPVVPSSGNKTVSSVETSRSGQITSQNNNVKYSNNTPSSSSGRGNHVNGNVNSEVIRQAIASPGNNHDLLTEL